MDAARPRKHVVVYLLMPEDDYRPQPSSPVVLALQQIMRIRQANMSLITYPLSIASITGWRSLTGSDTPVKALERLAFSVYDQLLIPVSSLAFPMPETFPSANLMRPQSLGPASRVFQSPAVTVSPLRESKIEFQLKWPAPSLEVLHRHRILHVAYTFVPGAAEGPGWIVVSCIDEKGEIWKTLPKVMKLKPEDLPEVTMTRFVWSIAKMLAETADVEWRVVISRIGVPNKAEIKGERRLLSGQRLHSGP